MPAVAIDDEAVVETRAVIIEDWAVVRRGLQAILESTGIATDAGAATAGDSAAALSGSDVALVVVGSVVGQSQRDLVEQAVKLGRRVLVLIARADQADVVELYRAGALAVVPRTASDPEIVTAFEHVVRGEAYVAPALVDNLFSRTAPVRRSSRMRFTLTPREQAVLALLVAGRSNREIAKELHIGTETVKTHVGNLYAKLDVDTRPSAVRVAIHHGLV